MCNSTLFLEYIAFSVRFPNLNRDVNLRQILLSQENIYFSIKKNNNRKPLALPYEKKLSTYALISTTIKSEEDYYKDLWQNEEHRPYLKERAYFQLKLVITQKEFMANTSTSSDLKVRQQYKF